MRALQAFAVAVALAASAAGTAQAAEKPLSREVLLELIRSDKVWCSGWRDKDQSCEDIAFVDPKAKAGNEITQISRYRVSADPDLQMVVRETVKLEGAALCSVFRFEDLEIVVLFDGEPASAEQALPILALLAQSMSGLEGKKACETFVQDAGELRSTVTLDGEPAPEFDSIYRLIQPETRILLRPMFEDTEATTIT